MKLKYLFVLGFVCLLIFSSFIFARQDRVNDEIKRPLMIRQEGMSIEQGENNRNRLRVGNISADCDCGLSQEQDPGQNRTRLYAHLSNGRKTEVKVMPDSASEKALERLRIRVCSGINNCSIELKETGTGNKTRVMYEVQAERHGRILGVFRAKMQVRAQVDAETGEMKVKKPWWAWLASEPIEDTEEQEADLEDSGE